MNSVYETIEELRKANHKSLREIALSADIPYRTFQYMMQHRSNTIRITALDAIAKVFGKRWYELLNIQHSEAMLMNYKGRVLAVIRPQTTYEQMKYLRQVNSIFYSYFDTKRQMLFVLKRSSRGMYCNGLAWYLSVTFGNEKHNIATFTIKDDGFKCYKEDYQGRLWNVEDILMEADIMISKMLQTEVSA